MAIIRMPPYCTIRYSDGAFHVAEPNCRHYCRLMMRKLSFVAHPISATKARTDLPLFHLIESHQSRRVSEKWIQDVKTLYSVKPSLHDPRRQGSSFLPVSHRKLKSPAPNQSRGRRRSKPTGFPSASNPISMQLPCSANRGCARQVIGFDATAPVTSLVGESAECMFQLRFLLHGFLIFRATKGLCAREASCG